jgi:hypothetical protein
MKQIFITILLLSFGKFALAQITHSFNIEYNIGYYFDKYPIRANPNLSIPPSLNYQLFFKNNGIMLFIKKIEVNYAKNFFDENTKKFPDSTILSRNTFFAGISYLRKFKLYTNFSLRPFIGGSFVRGGEFVHYGYYSSGGWNEPYAKSTLINKHISFNLGFKLNYELYKKVNLSLGSTYFNSLNNNIHNHLLTTDLSIGYIINKRRK